MSYYIFWISAILLIHIYIGYLGISILLGKIFRKTLIKKEIVPTVSLLIPAFNEQEIIGEKLENSLDLDYPKEKLEIVVVSESNDKTNSIISQYVERGVILYTYKTRQGKSKMLYDAVPKTKGEIIIFSDANAIYKKDALRKLVRNFSDQRIGGVLGRLCIANPEDSTISEGESIYKKYEGLLRKHNSYLHAVLGADGSMLGIRRELYSPVSPTQSDDFELAIRVRLKGLGVTFEPEAISYENAAVSSRDEIRRKIRIVSGFFRSSFVFLKEALCPFRGLLIFQIISNKILRWLSPYFLILFFFANLAIYKTHSFYGIVFALQILFYVIALTSGIYIKTTKRGLAKLLGMPFYFITFNLAFLVGVWKGLLCGHKSFWEKTRE